MAVGTSTSAPVSARAAAAAVAVALVWGLNFVAIGKGLEHFPPLLFVALRFALVGVPAVFLVGRPGARWEHVMLYGLLMGCGQFGFLFFAMGHGMPAGLASLVIQTQALFTLLFASLVLRELPRPPQVAGTLVASVGIAILAATRAAAVPLLPLLLTVAGGACWGASNLVARLARPASPFALIVWSGLVTPLPMLTLSLLTEGPIRDLAALRALDLAGVASLLYVVVPSTLVGFGVWALLLKRYPAATVAPFALLVPVAGVVSAWPLLGEVPSRTEVAAGAFVLAGLFLVSGAAPLVISALRRCPVIGPAQDSGDAPN